MNDVIRETATMSDPRIPLLLDILDRAYDRKGWHGTTLRGAVREVGPAEALWRPGKERHSIWELALHTAYWKYTVRRRLTGGSRGAFPRRPSNWPAPPNQPDAEAWAADLVLLDEEHAAFREMVAALTSEQLDARSPRGTWTNLQQIHGVAAHDLYHTGQIQLIRRLMSARRAKR